MLEQLLRHLKNYFAAEKYFGAYKIEKGSITLPFLIEGQYFRIIGSVFNDGIYKYPDATLTDEEFDGAIWALAIPPEVISLADEIKNWQEKYGENVNSPYQSESFGGYSYTAKNNNEGNNFTWKNAFANRLNEWRKI